MSRTTIRILAIIIPVIGSIIVALIAVDWPKLFNASEKQDVYEKLQEITKESEIYVLRDPLDNNTLKKVIEHKIKAIPIRRKINSLRQSTSDMDFTEWEEIAYGFERRYSYANIYSYAKLAGIVCGNLDFEVGQSLQINSHHLRKCNPSEFDDIIIGLISINDNNSSFKLQVSNDKNHMVCTQENEECEVEIEEGNRFASTSYQYVIIPEYIGYKGGHSNNKKSVSLSILERLNPQKRDAKGRTKDNSFWNYKLPAMKLERKQSENSTCSPFFDDNELTPQKPGMPKTLQDIDLDVLKACGPLRGQVTKEEFKAFTNKHFKQLQETFPHEWKGLDRVKIINRLLQIWMSYDAFTHIFCGEWEKGTVQGLHYWARYLQLQLENSACYFKSDEEELGEGGVFTIGVKSHDGANRNNKKGYALHQDVIDIMKLGNLAFERCCNAGGNWEVYRKGIYNKWRIVESLSNEKSIANMILFKTDNKDDHNRYGLLTIYPDARPDYRVQKCNP